MALRPNLMPISFQWHLPAVDPEHRANNLDTSSVSERITLDVRHTLMVEAEALMHSIAFINEPNAMENEERLTPNHFLLLRPYIALSPGVFRSTQPADMKFWKNLSQFLNNIWRKMFREYLPTLMKRPKWTENDGSSLKVDDVVWFLKALTPARYLALRKSGKSAPWKRSKQ